MKVIPLSVVLCSVCALTLAAKGGAPQPTRGPVKAEVPAPVVRRISAAPLATSAPVAVPAAELTNPPFAGAQPQPDVRVQPTPQPAAGPVAAPPAAPPAVKEQP